MGPTNSGKSTLINYAMEKYNAYGIFGGKILRERYGEDAFKGKQAADICREDAMKIMIDETNTGFKHHKLVMLDGQPREICQVDLIENKFYKKYRIIFLYLKCNDEVRMSRMEARDISKEKKKLSMLRFHNDVEELMYIREELEKRFEPDLIYEIDSENSFENFDKWISNCNIMKK
jgi:adenylate kinase family enzyme